LDLGEEAGTGKRARGSGREKGSYRGGAGRRGAWGQGAHRGSRRRRRERASSGEAGRLSPVCPGRRERAMTDEDASRGVLKKKEEGHADAACAALVRLLAAPTAACVAVE
jgi:hypothetical protein